MNTYYKISNQLKGMIGDEKIIWTGKPKKGCFILESIFNPLLIFALIWIMFDFGIISSFLTGNTNGNTNFLITIGIFLVLHLMPVWIYLAGAILSFRKYKNTEYAITERGIYIGKGCFAKQCDFKPFAELSQVHIHQGIFDQWLGVGDVIASCQYNYSGSARIQTNLFEISDISDYTEVCNIIKQYQTDIYADTQYPNAFRPRNNPGYKTNYQPDNDENNQ